MASVLLFRLEGPQQAWGADGAYRDRPTASEPTLSGVVGLLANSLGRRRGESNDDLCALAFAVRCDRDGTLSRDYQIAGMPPPRASAADPLPPRTATTSTMGRFWSRWPATDSSSPDANRH